MAFDFRLLSPEDRADCQRELLRLLDTRNESLSQRWGADRADRCTTLKITLGDFTGMAPGTLQEAMAHEFYLAGRELLDRISRTAEVG